jgi:hypothetical protein
MIVFVIPRHIIGPHDDQNADVTGGYNVVQDVRCGGDEAVPKALLSNNAVVLCIAWGDATAVAEAKQERGSGEVIDDICLDVPPSPKLDRRRRSTAAEVDNEPDDDANNKCWVPARE